MINVLVADDHPIVRRGLVDVIESEPDMTVVGEAENGVLAVEGARALRPDIVLMDLKMPGLNGVDATEQVIAQAKDEDREIAVLVVTMFESDTQILDAIGAGAKGYVLKAAPASEIVAAVRAVAAGSTVLAPSLAVKLARLARERESQPTLSEREVSILSLVAVGMSNADMAAKLFISESTVKSHLKSIFSKLEVTDRTLAVTKAMSMGLIPHPLRRSV
jgi:DNA-binding NarL/FixJ family response regulator